MRPVPPLSPLVAALLTFIARAVMSQRIEIGREVGDEFLIWVESANLSMVERQLGNLAEAEALPETPCGS